MDREVREQDTDEENANEGIRMDLDEVINVEIISKDFWNDFGDLLDDEDYA